MSQKNNKPLPRCLGCEIVLSPDEIKQLDKFCGTCLEFGLGRPEEADLCRPWEEVREVRSDTYD